MPSRSEYPICPRCGSPVVGAMMTSGAITVNGFVRGDRQLHEEPTYYHPSAISVYCMSASCNWDYPLAELVNPPPKETEDDE